MWMRNISVNKRDECVDVEDEYKWRRWMWI